MSFETVAQRKPKYCELCGKKLEFMKWKDVSLFYDMYTGKKLTDTTRAMTCTDCEVIWVKSSHSKGWVDLDSEVWVSKIREWVEAGKPRVQVVEEMMEGDE